MVTSLQTPHAKATTMKSEAAVNLAGILPVQHCIRQLPRDFSVRHEKARDSDKLC